MAFSAPFFFLPFLVFNFADFFGCLFLTTVLSPKEKPAGKNWSATGYELVWSEISPVSADLRVNWQSAAAPLSKTKPSSARVAQKVGVYLLMNGGPCWTSVDRHFGCLWGKRLNEVFEEIHTKAHTFQPSKCLSVPTINYFHRFYSRCCPTLRYFHSHLVFEWCSFRIEPLEESQDKCLHLVRTR